MGEAVRKPVAKSSRTTDNYSKILYHYDSLTNDFLGMLLKIPYGIYGPP